MGDAVEPFRFPFKAMGLACDVQMFAPDGDDAGHAFGLVMAEFTRLELAYSSSHDDSELFAISRAAAEGGAIAVGDEMAGLLNHAAKYFAESDGLFDVTAGPLRRAWLDRATPPDDDELVALRAKTGWDKLRWNAPHLSFPMPGLAIDFDRLLPQYAADRAANVLRAAGVGGARVTVGADVHVTGPRDDGEPWRVGIPRPPAQDGMVALAAMREGALATAGEWDRVLTVAGARYGRAIDPKTGRPAGRLASVSVAADLCATAGTIATIALLKGDVGPAWLGSQNVAYLWVDVDGNSGGSLVP